MQVRNLRHPLLPALSPDERGRQRSVVALRRVLNAHVRPRNVELYEREGSPSFEARHQIDIASGDQQFGGGKYPAQHLSVRANR